MHKLDNAYLVDILLGFSFGKLVFPGQLLQGSPKKFPKTFMFDGQQLVAAKELAESRNKLLQSAIKDLCQRSDLLLEMKNPTVTDKKNYPDLAKTNDYVSLAKYWWPSSNPGGIPYVRKDGEVNPECYSENYDSKRLETFCDAVIFLAITSFLSDEKKYADKAISLINTWIVDPATRQNPHFRFSQIVPAVDDVRCWGLIEARRLVYVCDALKILNYLNLIDDQTYRICRHWFWELSQWLEKSEVGRKAIKLKNNIGFWVDLERVVFAKFAGKEKLAEDIIRNSTIPRISEQIELDGRLPAELSRERPYDYVIFTLLAMAGLSKVGESEDVKLTEFSDAEGRSFQNAFDWLNTATKTNNFQDSSIMLAEISNLREQIASVSHNVEEATSENTETKILKLKLQKSQSDLVSVIEKNRYLENIANYLKQTLDNTERDLLERKENNKFLSLEQELATLRQTVNQFQQSLSWRITKPLRWMNAKLKKGKPSLKLVSFEQKEPNHNASIKRANDKRS